jgi:hypothetical protein
LASDFNRDITLGMAPAEAPTDPTPASPEAPVLSPAAQRFKTCRWQQPTEGGSAEFCTHREVKPYAGSATFDPEAWCGDCQLYKLRRVPKKRAPNDDWGY